MEEETLIDQGALLFAVLQAEFFDDNFRLQHLSNDQPIDQDRMGMLSVTIDSWYSDKIEKLHAEFDFLTAMRPAKITDLVVVHGSALIEICQGDEEVEDFGAIDIENDLAEKDSDAVEGDEDDAVDEEEPIE